MKIDTIKYRCIKPFNAINVGEFIICDDIYQSLVLRPRKGYLIVIDIIEKDILINFHTIDSVDFNLHFISIQKYRDQQINKVLA